MLPGVNNYLFNDVLLYITHIIIHDKLNDYTNPNIVAQLIPLAVRNNSQLLLDILLKYDQLDTLNSNSYNKIRLTKPDNYISLFDEDV